jgi:hypothetical protein
MRKTIFPGIKLIPSILIGMAIFLLPTFYAQALPNQSACTTDAQCDSQFCAPGYNVCTNPYAAINIEKPESELQPLQFTPQVPIPGFNFNPNDKTTGNIANLVKALYNYGISIVGIVAAIAMVIGGLIWMTAGGNASKVGEAQAWIGGALSGLVLALFSWFMFNTINPDLVNFKVRSITGITPNYRPTVNDDTVACGTWDPVKYSCGTKCPEGSTCQRSIKGIAGAGECPITPDRNGTYWLCTTGAGYGNGNCDNNNDSACSYLGTGYICNMRVVRPTGGYGVCSKKSGANTICAENADCLDGFSCSSVYRCTQ